MLSFYTRAAPSNLLLGQPSPILDDDQPVAIDLVRQRLRQSDRLSRSALGNRLTEHESAIESPALGKLFSVTRWL